MTTGHGQDMSPHKRAVLDRRMAIKAAVGAGVAGAVWTGPNVQTLGFAPAYASHTSPSVGGSESFDEPFEQNQQVTKGIVTVTRSGNSNNYSVTVNGSDCQFDVDGGPQLSSPDPSVTINSPTFTINYHCASVL